MKTRRPSLTARMAEQVERQAFASQVLLVAADHQHDDCAHADCAVHGPCRLREALKASTERIARDGAELADEYRQRKGAS